MFQTNIIKTILFCITSVLSSTGLLLFIPKQAYAEIGWSSDEITGQLNIDTDKASGDFSTSKINAWVTSITAWLVGIAVIIFVLRIVLTAIDRMILSDAKNDGFRLSDIPLVGAYDEEITWKDIWLKKFALPLGIVCGAWVIVQVLMGFILWVISSVT